MSDSMSGKLIRAAADGEQAPLVAALKTLTCSFY